MTVAYLGSYTAGAAAGRGIGIGIANADTATGGLTLTATVAVADPSYLALAPGGRYLYAVNEGPAAGYATAVDLNTGPGVMNTVAVQGEGPTHLCLAEDGRYLLTANYQSGSVSVLEVSADGRLGMVTDVVQHTGSGPEADRQAGPHVHQVQPDPTGRWILVVDLGVDAVYVYRLAAGELHAHARVASAPGSGPRHLSFHPDGRRAYLANELDSTVTVCDWRADTGELRMGMVVPAVPEATSVRNAPAEPVLSRDGGYLYLANRGPDVITTFAIKGAAISALGTVPCGGALPRDLRLGPDGTRLYVANQDSGVVSWLDLDPGTGLPKLAGRLEFPAVTSVLFA